MTAFMNRSVDLLEARAAESGNGFSMNRRGYYFLSATEAGAARHAEVARSAARLGLGSGAVHAGAGHGVAYDGATAAHDASVDGLSVFQGSEAIGAFFGGLPQFVAPEVTSVLRCGRCGWLSAQQMGAQLLDDAREAHGVRTLTPAALTAVHADGGAVSGVDVRTADGERCAWRAAPLSTAPGRTRRRCTGSCWRPPATAAMARRWRRCRWRMRYTQRLCCATRWARCRWRRR